jgi:hypothetical protein
MLRFSSRMKLDLPSRLAMPARKVDHMAEANSKRAIIAGIVMIAIYAVQFVAAASACATTSRPATWPSCVSRQRAQPSFRS